VKYVPNLGQHLLAKAIKAMHKLPINIVIVTVGLVRQLELESQVKSAAFQVHQWVENLTLSEIHRGQVQRETSREIDAEFEDPTLVGTSMHK